MDCVVTIASGGASEVSLALDFTSFAIDLEQDLLFVYDGNGTASRLVDTFSGVQLPPQVAGPAGAPEVSVNTEQPSPC